VKHLFSFNLLFEILVYTRFNTCAKLFNKVIMKKISESEIEKYFCWVVEMNAGKTWKFKSPAQRGVADRIACLPNGGTWFVELKTKGGKLSELQKMFGQQMQYLNQRYAVLWTHEQIDAWLVKVKT
jgi:hypothetical protein